MVSARILKSEALCWLRWTKQMPIVCTEVGRFSADVFGICKKFSIEIETKISKSDIKADFAKKTGKHQLYKSPLSYEKHIPNYFYFLVPEKLVEFTIQQVKEHNPKIGVLSYEESESSDVRVTGVRLSVPHRPTKLHDEEPSVQMIQAAMVRMSSEICGLHKNFDKLSQKFETLAESSLSEAATVAAMASGTLDFESPEEDIQNKATMLAEAVEGAKYSDLDKAGQEKWKAIATQYMKVLADYYHAKKYF